MIEFDTLQVKKFSEVGVYGTHYLVFRDLKKFCDLYQINTNKVLDLGCGSGRSTHILAEFCNEVVGIDISVESILIAKEKNPALCFYLNDSSHATYPCAPFNAIFSILMLFHLGSAKDIKIEFNKSYKSLSEEGHLIIVGGTKNMYFRSYRDIKGIGPIPQHSGESATVELTNINCIIKDIFWEEADIIKIADDCGFTYCGAHYPLGMKSDNQSYIDEYQYPPYYYLTFKKCK